MLGPVTHDSSQIYILRCQEIAAELPLDSVYSGTLQAFLEAGRDDDIEALEQLERDLQALDAQYADLHLAPQEVTAETVAAHEVITSALDVWLWCLEQALSDNPDWEELRHQAEQAQRLLLAVSVWQAELLSYYPETEIKPWARA